MTPNRASFLGTALLAMGLSGCGWFVDWFEVDEPESDAITIKGTVAVPDGPTGYTVLSSSSHLAYQWYSCPEFNNNSALSGGSFLLESTNNCAGAQFVYFFSETPIDLTAYATGEIRFKVQANNAGQGLSLLVQDANAVPSKTVDLAGYGFDSGTVGVDQAVAVPVTALTNGSAVALSQVKRAFQLQVSCPAAGCFTTVSDIRWEPGAVLPAPFTPAALRDAPRCDPFPCRRLPRARVGIYKSSPLGWKAEPAVSVRTTDDNGNYTLTASEAALANDGPIYVAVSDFEGTFTLLSLIAESQVEAGADIDVDVDRSSTAAAMMVCPNGMTIPADGSGGWCIGDPISTTEKADLETVIDASLDVSVSLEIDVIVEDALGSPDVLAELNQLLADHGLPSVTADQVANQASAIALPIVTAVPVANPGTGGISGAKQCQGAVTCEVCSITACASGGDANTCRAWYETSTGQTYQCASCEDCAAAAQAATNACCPTPQ